MEEFERVLVAIRRITRAIDMQSKKLMTTAGLTVPQLLVMQAIQKHGQVSISTIAGDVSLSQGTVTTVVDRLEKAGYVQRVRSDKDKRVVFAVLTEPGREKLQKAPESIQANFVREFKKLEPWEQSMVTAAFERVARMMDATNIDASPILAVGEIPETLKTD